MMALKCDLNKTVINPGFAGAVFITVLLCFTANVYTDVAIDKNYSVFEVIFNLDKKIIQADYTFSWICVFTKCLSGYITMFIPIISVFPFMITFCAERNNGLIRFTIARTGKMRYYLSKFLSCFISGGLSVLLGVFVFGIFVKLYFPNTNTYEMYQDQLSLILPHGEFSAIIRTLISAFLYGAVSTLPAFMLSSFCKNPYLITCIPFMIIYIWNTSLEKIQLLLIEAEKWEELKKIYPYYPNSIITTLQHDLDKTGKTALIFNAVYTLALVTGFIVIMNLRTDKGA